MRNLKILIVLFAGLGIVSLLLNIDALKAGFKEDLASTAMVLGGFVLAALMGLMGIMKPPAVAWQGAVALAGFALVAVKVRIWETLPKIMDVKDTGMKLTLVAAAGGVIVSLLAAIKPENKS